METLSSATAVTYSLARELAVTWYSLFRAVTVVRAFHVSDVLREKIKIHFRGCLNPKSRLRDLEADGDYKPPEWDQV
jgi:hypothetical protein